MIPTVAGKSRSWWNTETLYPEQLRTMKKELLTRCAWQLEGTSDTDELMDLTALPVLMNMLKDPNVDHEEFWGLFSAWAPERPVLMDEMLTACGIDLGDDEDWDTLEVLMQAVPEEWTIRELAECT